MYCVSLGPFFSQPPYLIYIMHVSSLSIPHHSYILSAMFLAPSTLPTPQGWLQFSSRIQSSRFPLLVSS